MVTRIKTVCADCGYVIHEGPLDPEGRCSHGMCVKCLIERYSEFYTDAELKEMRNEVARQTH
jgi:hypothetical protein